MKKVIKICDKKFICYPIKNGEGKCAKCYLTKDNRTLKVYRSNLSDDEKYYEDSLKALEGIKNDTFAFPEELFVDNGIVLGYIYRYIKGDTLSNSRNINIELFLSMLDKVYSDLEDISKKKIFASDMGQKNIIFNNKFNIIDTDNYFVFDYSSFDICLNSNMEVFNRSILDYILKNSRIDSSLYIFIHSSDKFESMIYELTNRDNPSPILKDFIEELVYSLEKETGRNIKTFDDIHKSLVRR